MPYTGTAPTSAGDRSGAHKTRRMQEMEDGKSKEARSGDTMGDCSECDVLYIFLSFARSWSLHTETSKQTEALETKAAWPTPTRRHGRGLRCLAVDPCPRMRLTNHFEPWCEVNFACQFTFSKGGAETTK